jgi:hypothetical protein
MEGRWSAVLALWKTRGYAKISFAFARENVTSESTRTSVTRRVSVVELTSPQKCLMRKNRSRLPFSLRSPNTCWAI